MNRQRGPRALVLPLAVATVLLIGWEAAVRFSRSDLFPGPWEVGLGIVELIRKGKRFRRLQTVPIGLKPVWLVTEVPRCCQFAGKTSQGVAGENRPLLR